MIIIFAAASLLKLAEERQPNVTQVALGDTSKGCTFCPFGMNVPVVSLTREVSYPGQFVCYCQIFPDGNTEIYL